VSSIASITSGASSATTGADTTKLAGSKDEFLKLFMAQLQHQDPLSPKNGSDMVAQLAQFSQVEQSTQTNQQLAALAVSQSSTANASLSSLVGRSCTASLGDVTIKDPSNIPPISVSSTGTITGASVVVKDADGHEVRRIAIPANGGPVSWDGRDASGNLVKQGSYSMSVDSGTTTTAITANWNHAIDGVVLSATGSSLKMGGIEVSPSTITTIGAAASQAVTTATTATADAITAALATSSATNGNIQ